LEPPEDELVVNMAAKHRFPGRQVCKTGRCRISADSSESDKLEFGADVATRVDFCARRYGAFRQVAGDSDSDKVNIPCWSWERFRLQLQCFSSIQKLELFHY